MTKIYDALRRAEEERGNNAEPPIEPSFQAEKKPRNQSFRQKMIAVYQAIETGLPEKSSRAVLFVSSRAGEGASALVRELAVLAESEFAQRVVLIDAAQGAGGHHEHFGLHMQAGLDDVVSERMQLDEVLQEVDRTGLFVGCLSASRQQGSFVPADPKFENIMNDLRKRFSLVLFDSPPLAESSDALVLVPSSDGVVMVVEAEKTRWQVAENVRERLVMQGANILGVILNRRRFHIPRLIYKFL